MSATLSLKKLAGIQARLVKILSTEDEVQQVMSVIEEFADVQGQVEKQREKKRIVLATLKEQTGSTYGPSNKRFYEKNKERLKAARDAMKAEKCV